MFFSNAQTRRKGSCDSQTSYISAEDMNKIQGSLDLDDPVGLQNKVFIDVMTLNSFEICEELGGNATYLDLGLDFSLTLKDTLTKNNGADKLEKSQGGVIS